MTHHYDSQLTRITHLTCDVAGCTSEYRDNEPDIAGRDMRDRAFKFGWWRGVTDEVKDVCPFCVEASRKKKDYSNYRALTWGEFKAYVDKKIAEESGDDSFLISWIDVSHESFDPSDPSTIDVCVTVSGKYVEIS